MVNIKHSKSKSRKKTLKNKSSKKTKLLKKSKHCPVNLKCAPGNQPNLKTCSCLSKQSLLKIVDVWNKQNENNTIKVSKKPSEVYLWKQIHERMKDKCKTEWCWIQQEYIKKINNDDINNSYRPKMPTSWKQNKYEWLKTDDIENVMDQYEDAYPDFYFIGPVPIDFDKPYGIGHCVVDELCKLNISSIYDKGIRKIGIVFNLDPHDKPGSHWVSMYCSLNGKNKGIFYFDSYGIEPPNEVDILMKRLQNQGKLLNLKLNIKVNNVRHQYKNSECGVYSIFFITELLTGSNFNKLIKSTIMDDSMNNKRQYFFVDNA